MIVTIAWIAVNDSSDPDRCDRWWIAGTEQDSILAILIVAITRIVRACFHKIAGIAAVVHSNPNDRNDYMETRLNNETITAALVIMRCTDFSSESPWH